uniref:C2H2-type domain-containing protein n=1 Tax=Anopheles quadriannulatus TaxID=34691 RepID=A0A182XG13_ANOQN
MKCEELFGMYITSPSGVQRSLSKIIRECVSIEVSEMEPSYVSKFICNGCVYKLEQFYAFRQQSLKCQEYYNGLLQYYQQSIPCSSKTTLDATAVVVQMPESVDSVFESHQQIQPDQSIHSSNELADINFSANEFMMDESEKNQLSKDYDDIIRSLQKDDLDFTTNDDELVSLSEAHVQEIIADVYNATAEKQLQSAEELPSSQQISGDVQCSEISGLQPSDSYFSMVDFDESDAAGVATSSTTTVNEAKDLPNDKTCEICFKTFRTRQKLTVHRNTHLRLAPFKCTFEGCAKAFKSRIGLDEHVARHTNSFEYTCDICSKGFQHRSYLSAHRRAHNTERNFQCGLCGQSFKAKQALLDHKNRHLGVKPFACEQCDKQYTKNSLLQSHIQQHHGKRDEAITRYPCSECGKQFTSKSYLNVHMRIHRNERPFVCEVCNKGHITRKDLAVHMLSHTGEKPHTCEFCGKAYARRNALDWHRRSHTKERPYICDICGQTFSQPTPLQVHRKLHDTADRKKQLPIEEQQQQLATEAAQDQTR